MKQSGRTSAAGLMAVATGPLSRPEPYPWLTEAQAAIWRAITASKPADWFDDANLPLLERYVVLIDSGREIQRLLTLCQDDKPLERVRLLDAYNQTTPAIKTLAASMRLAQQSKYGAQKAAAADRAAASPRKPWERAAS